MEEETKAGEAAEAATPAAPAVSEEKKKEKEAEALKMLEFYFGDSNFGWDRFMQSKVRYELLRGVRHAVGAMFWTACVCFLFLVV